MPQDAVTGPDCHQGAVLPAARRLRGRPALVRAWAGFDLVVTGLLATPPSAAWFLRTLYGLEAVTGGSTSPPPFAPVQWLFVCLAGTLGVLWAAVRLRDPRPGFALADALARLWVAGLILYFVAARGAPRVLLLFVATELAGSASQLRALRRGPRDRT